MSLAYIFPGQGSQYPGMGKSLAENFPATARLFEEFNDALRFSISQLCFEGSAEDLQLTENTQPAIFAASAAAFGAMKSEGFPIPDFVAGHSLGEYSALFAARSVSAGDAIQTVRARGRYMQKAVPVGVGAMAAVIGADLEVIEKACVEAAHDQVCAPANINSPSQVVIAGHTEAVERAGELLRGRGAKRVLKLNVSAPFHSALMMPAQERLAFDLERIVFNNLATPLVTNVDATLIESGAEALDSLVRQVSSPVRWLQSIELLIKEGVDTFIEVGPGKILTGLMRQISRQVKCYNVEDADSLKHAGASLGIS
jgi:[acyl-carrier-protein] S-malonyltransferase